MINDLWHYWGGDLAPGNTGDLLTVTGTERGQQRVLRRLLTNPGEYLWHPEYGAGLPSKIGRPLDKGKLIALIRAHLALESVVAQSPTPQIAVGPLGTDPTGITVAINYTDAATKEPTTLSFNLSR